MMELENMTIDQIEQFEIPTATPILYLFDKNGQPLSWHYLNKDTEQSRSA